MKKYVEGRKAGLRKDWEMVHDYHKHTVSSEVKHFISRPLRICVCVYIHLYLLLNDSTIITWDASAVVAQTFFLFSLSDSISFLSTGLYQLCCQSLLLFISPLAWIHTFSHNSLSLSDSRLPSPIPPHLFTCCHMLVPAQCLHPPLSQLLLAAFCTFPLPSIPSPCIHSCPIALSAALLPPTSSLSPCIILSCPYFHLTILAFKQQMCVSVHKKNQTHFLRSLPSSITRGHNEG